MGIYKPSHLVCADTPGGPTKVRPTPQVQLQTLGGFLPRASPRLMWVPDTMEAKKGGVSTATIRVISTPTVNGIGNCGSTASAKSDHQHSAGNCSKVFSYNENTMHTQSCIRCGCQGSIVYAVLLLLVGTHRVLSREGLATFGAGH